MQTLKIDRSRYTLSPTRDAGAFAEKLRKCTGKTKLSPIKSDRRVYPKFSAGDSTAEYVHRYWVANGFSDDHRKFFAPLNTKPATLYSGEDTHETVDDFELCAPVESIQTAPDDIAQTEPAAVESAPDAPIDPAPVCEPVESPALQATRAHPWMTHAARRVYWVHCETARFSRELGPLPFGSMFRRPRSPGFMSDFLAPEIRAHRAAVAAAVRADRAAKRAPVDPAPRAGAAPVDTGAAPGGWMRPAAGMLSEAEARAWPSAEPIESAPTPGYAFPADALPATHSDAAPVDVDTMRAQLCAVEDAILAAAPRKFSNGQYGGDIEAAARSRSVPAELKRRRKTLRAMISAARDAAADPAPVPGDSDPVPVNSADVDAVEVARLVAKFRQFADERRRTGDTLAAAIRVESAEARYRADSLTAPNAFRDAPGAGHEAAKAHDTRRAAEYRAAAAELDRLADAMPADDAAPVATHSAPIAEPVALATHSAPVDADEQQTGETAETWFERIRRESAEKRARIDALADVVAAGSGSIGFTHPSDPARYGIAGPDMSGRGAFRFTYFDAAGPIGDAIRPSLADAIAAGVEYGFTVDAAPLEWPENPAPDAAPVPTHSATHPDVFNVFNVWQELRAGRADPTEYQAHVLECVAAAKADGLFYNSEVWPRAAVLMADRFGYPDARSAGADNGVASEFGTHCYCAGDVLSIRHKAELNRTAAAGFRAGQVFPRLIFNDGKNVTGARLSSMSHTGESCKLTGKRGRYSVEFECEAYSLQCAIERAAERAGILAKRRGDAKPRAPIAPAPVPGDTKAEPVPADTAPDDDTIPAPLDGLDVIETADAETLAEFDRLSRAPGVAPPATDARPIPAGPVLRIPAGDLRARIPARFAPGSPGFATPPTEGEG